MMSVNLLRFLTLNLLHPLNNGAPAGAQTLNTEQQNIYATPCPDIFRYHLEDGQVKYGEISVGSVNGNVLQLNVEISVGNQVQGFNGDLILAKSKVDTIQDILHRRPVNYRLYFPRWFNFPPKITKIEINGDRICTGVPISIKSVRILTTIQLQHTLKMNGVNVNNFGSFDGGGGGDSIETSGGGIRFDERPFNIDFNPARPKDPGKIYPGNPFLNPPRDAFLDDDDVEKDEKIEKDVKPVSTRATPTFNSFVFKPDDVTDSPTDTVTTSILSGLNINGDLCGLSVSTNTLVANGENVKKGQYPWLVAIFNVKSLGPEFLCGGNLISDKHVVTAGHCMKSNGRVHQTTKVFLRLGEHNIHQWTQMLGSRTVGVSRIIVHPEYRTISAHADLAIVVLSDAVEFTRLIRPICLWDRAPDLDRVVGSIGTVAGWGKDESNAEVTPEPKQVRFPIVSQEDCLRSHITFRDITSTKTFCAGYRNGSGPCNGDSGSGFALNRKDRWYLRGIVSMSIAKDHTCDFSHYFVFSDVAKYIEWIVHSIRNNNF